MRLCTFGNGTTFDAFDVKGKMDATMVTMDIETLTTIALFSLVNDDVTSWTSIEHAMSRFVWFTSDQRCSCPNPYYLNLFPLEILFSLGTEDLDGSVLKTARSSVPGL
ncbi:uncharacterized protein LOC105182967 [Harpegnathos saltator]|uniref:uncharacterized protein LOC105182967 n=1 Tax=Harpegnathos saltator TaxID=610380 RepID=UPI000948AD5B|nr:uncharacterized protein LOC105182967 [Harpegnathos saltator]